MKSWQIATSILTITTLSLAIRPVFANPSTNLPDFSKVENPLDVCKTNYIGTEDHSVTETHTETASSSNINNSPLKIYSPLMSRSAIYHPMILAPQATTNPEPTTSSSKTQKDTKVVVGHDCDGIADALSKVESNRQDNETIRYVTDKKAQAEFLKSLMSW